MMGSDARKCPVEGCKRYVSYNKLMCPTHWRSVPDVVQIEVYRAWNLGDPAADYLQISQKAIDVASGKQEV